MSTIDTTATIRLTHALEKLQEALTEAQQAAEALAPLGELAALLSAFQASNTTTPAQAYAEELEADEARLEAMAIPGEDKPMTLEDLVFLSGTNPISPEEMESTMTGKQNPGVVLVVNRKTKTVRCSATANVLGYAYQIRSRLRCKKGPLVGAGWREKDVEYRIQLMDREDAEEAAKEINQTAHEAGLFYGAKAPRVRVKRS